MAKSLVYFSLMLLAILANASASASMSRDQALKDLTAAKSQNGAALNEIEIKLKGLLGPGPADSLLAVSINEPELERLVAQRQELLLRQQLMDRLLLQIDSRFKGGDLRLFLSERLVEMAKTDLLESSGRQSLWKQMTYLSQTLRQIPERGENIISFINGYLKSSSFASPLRPNEYMRSREYSNASEHVAATPVAKDQVGASVEKKILELEGPASEGSLGPSAN